MIIDVELFWKKTSDDLMGKTLLNYNKFIFVIYVSIINIYQKFDIKHIKTVIII